MTTNFPPEGFILTDSAVDGILVYKPIPEEEAHNPVVEFHCPNCDGATAYCAANGGLTCTYCQYYEPPEKEVVGQDAERFEFTVETMHRVAHGWGAERQELVCNRCGVHTTLPTADLTHTCPFCSSNSVVQTKAPQDVLRPRALVPLTVDADGCRKIVADWFEGNWMLPDGLTRLARTAEFTPVYIPFWVFDGDTDTAWRAEVGRNRNGRTTTRLTPKSELKWKWEKGKVYTQVKSLMVSGTSKVDGEMLTKIRPFDLHALVPYEASYLAGVQAQAYDIDLEEAWAQGREIVRKRAKQLCLTKTSTMHVRNFTMKVAYGNESWRYILVPIYIASYQYGKKSYQVMVNGQTGELAGRRPVDWRKVWRTIAGLFVPTVLFYLVGLISGQRSFAAFGQVLAILATIVTIFLIHTANKLKEI